ncbi:MAG: ribose 5-phosphate isomerase B [Deltaproteobacteria bacterium GWA2_38_16]|nr:MAG: ribose 5-phosphate isomerase B [Deltaproteobacteria bacterium GWA2_38_16]OGQ02575.1 MAG: ribose 5-phosphate isomerase B [Deltaproteobacteria bacterium RIFCSPHIGHO2_02_FULL_38_15]OGQ60402.1 MAG: ribose 5-phosphate isomerase B [Deltaproteobacteria bacterium RIFCSPLOWO2_12_FULL_38_8]HBQ20969.1 ribose 5-phosphate isomerase B [Deltaproteobacteria bacterium]
MKIAIGNDHRGYQLKKLILNSFKDISFVDVGCNSEERVDYPDFAAKVAKKVSEGECERGILMCGSGVGMSIVANKFLNVRAALVWDTKIAQLTRLHNDSNVLCLAADFIKDKKVFEIIKTWLKTSFEGGRHAVRLQKIKDIENGQ